MSISFEQVEVVYIFRYFHLHLQKSIKNKEEERSGTTGTSVSQKDLQRMGETNKQKKRHWKGEVRNANWKRGPYWKS